MDIKAVMWMGFICTCIIATSVDSVEPDYLIHKRQRAKIGRKKPFNATATKCCKIGYRTARKRMSCGSAQSGQRTLNRSIKAKLRVKGKRVQSEKKKRQLQLKIAKCAKGFFKAFYKCCTYKESFYSQMKLCKIKHRRKRDRKKCKRLLRKKYS
ncbi:hypothetical protein FSP39_022652 [Pinctada imbricata]|uniref:Uncharacterized protein n=1 Tax=Pinctada imbricata TaxID=66713 RepID=A0AA88XWT0_PINIB|nr:hypothetical protein FSP39_022652 [Pinctada imbricata]